MGLFGFSQKSDEEIAEFEQSEADKKLVSFVKKGVEDARANAGRMSFESTCMTNIAYLLGIDGVSFNAQTRQFQPINRASAAIKKNRIHVNKVLPTIQNRLARLCKNPPRYDVRPESNDTEDKEAARLGKQVLSAMWDKLSLDEKRIQLYMWAQQAGHAYVKIFWDVTEGKPMVDPETGEPGYEGDVAADIVSPLEIFPDPMAKTFAEVRKSYLTQCKVRKIDYFKANYKKGHLVQPEDCWLLSAQYEQRINSMNNRTPSQGGLQEQMKNSAIEMIRYEARSKDYPNGRMIVCANGVLLEDKELPIGEIPFAKFDDVIIAGKYNSEAIITHLRPVQDQFNETIRRRAEWVKKLLAGKYKAARGSGLSQESMTDETEVVYFDVVPNAPSGPEPVQVPMIPQWAYQEEKSYDESFNEISGISDVSKGIMPSASIPAIGMQLLTEQDDSRIGVMIEQHEHAWADVGALILKYVQAFYVLPRKLKIAGKSLQYTVKEVKGEDLRDNTDVYVVRGSTLPGSKTLKTQEILNRYTQGLLGDPADPKTRQMVNEMTEFGNSEECFVDYGLMMAKINRGIKKLEEGESLEYREPDNHALWAQELNRYIISDKFESLAPEIKALFEATLEQHIQGVMQVSNMMPPPTDPQQIADAFDAANPPPQGLDPANPEQPEQAPPQPPIAGVKP